MDRVGTDESGFTVSVDLVARGVRIEAWGFWPVEVCSAFGQNVVDAFRRSVGLRRLEMEATRLKPLREEGERAWEFLLSSLPTGVEVFVVKTNSLTRLQLMRIAKLARDKKLVQFE
jgi:hypothetical protein